MEAKQALAGLRVVEYGQFISAPYCAKMMADMGAEVIKVEDPEGDWARHYGPFPGDKPHPERSGLFLYLNTNKLGVTLNLRTATGRQIFHQLVKDADVLVENQPPAAMAEAGLDYETLKAINPGLIVTSITPFGGNGPYKDYRGYAVNTAALGGMAYGVGRPDREPLASPGMLANYQGAVHAAAATMIAVTFKDATGRGQQVDISEAECMATIFGGPAVIRFVHRGEMVQRAGHRVSLLYPYTVLPCKDGFFSMVALEEHQWDRFVVAMGSPDWAKDPRFGTRLTRAEHADELDRLLAPFLKSHTKEELFALCRNHQVPFCPVNNVADMAQSAHLKERGFLVEVNHTAAGPLTYLGAPYRFSQTPWEIRRPAPLLGEHNEEIYCGRLGYARQDLPALRRGGVI